MAEYSIDPLSAEDDAPELIPVEPRSNRPRPPKAPDRRKPRPPTPPLTREQQEQRKASAVIEEALGKTQKFKPRNAPESLEETRARLAAERGARVPTKAQYRRFTPEQRLAEAERRAGAEGRPLVVARAQTPEEAEYVRRLEELESSDPLYRAAYSLYKKPEEAFAQATESLEAGIFETPSSIRALGDLLQGAPPTPLAGGLGMLLSRAGEAGESLTANKRAQMWEEIRGSRRQREFLQPALSAEQEQRLGPYIGAAGEVLGAAASSTPLIALGAVGGEFAVPSMLTSGIGGAFQGQGQVAEEFDASKSADPERRRFAILMGGLTGATEALGLEGAINRLGVGKAFRRKALEILQDTGQEALQEWLGNVNAAYVGAYDPSRPLSKDVLKSAVLGAIISGGFQAAAGGEAPRPGPGTASAERRSMKLLARPADSPITDKIPYPENAPTADVTPNAPTTDTLSTGFTTGAMAPYGRTTDQLTPLEERETGGFTAGTRAMIGRPDWNPIQYTNDYLQKLLDEEGLDLTVEDAYSDAYPMVDSPGLSDEQRKIIDLRTQAYQYGHWKAWTESAAYKYKSVFLDKNEAIQEALSSGGSIRTGSVTKEQNNFHIDKFPKFYQALSHLAGGMNSGRARGWVDGMIRDIEAGKITWSQMGLQPRPEAIPQVLAQAKAFRDWYDNLPERVVFHAIDAPPLDKYQLGMNLQKRVFKQDARLTQLIGEELGLDPESAWFLLDRRAKFPETAAKNLQEEGVADPETLSLVSKRAEDQHLLTRLRRELGYGLGPQNSYDAVTTIRRGGKLMTQLPATLQDVIGGPERQENLNNFLQDSKAKRADGTPIVGFVPSTLPVEPEVIDPQFENSEMDYGPGIYLFQDSEVANQATVGRLGISYNDILAHPEFARRAERAQFNEFWAYGDFETEAEFDRMREEAEKRASDTVLQDLARLHYANVRPFYMNITNPFDLNEGFTPDQIDDFRVAAAQQAGGEYLPDDFLVGFEEDYVDDRTGTAPGTAVFEGLKRELRGADKAIELLKSLGYDGLVVRQSLGYERGQREYATQEEAMEDAEQTGGILNPPAPAPQREFDMMGAHDLRVAQSELTGVLMKLFPVPNAPLLSLTPSGWGVASAPNTISGNDLLADVYNWIDNTVPPDWRDKSLMDLTMDVMREWGFDVITNYHPDGTPLQLRSYRGETGWTVNGSRIWVAWYADQIKSSTGNVGTFDSEEQNVRAAQGGPLVAPEAYTPGALREMEQRAQNAGRPIVLLPETLEAFRRQMDVARGFMMTEGLDPEMLQNFSDRYVSLAQAVEEAANLPPLVTPASLRDYVAKILWQDPAAIADYLEVLDPTEGAGSRAPAPTDDELSRAQDDEWADYLASQRELRDPLGYKPYRVLVPQDQFQAPVLYAPESLFRALGFFDSYQDALGNSVEVPHYGVNMNISQLEARFDQIEAASNPLMVEIDRYFMTPAQASEAIAQLKAVAQISEERGLTTISIANTDAVGKTFLENIVTHETFHAGQQAAALHTLDAEIAAAQAAGRDIDPRKVIDALLFLHDPDWAENHPLVQRVRAQHGWVAGRSDLPIHTTAMEMAAYIAGGDGAMLGLTLEEQATYLLDYLENIVENRGPDALLVLERVAQLKEYTRDAITSVKERYLDPLGGHGSPERSFARSERNALTVSVSRPELGAGGDDIRRPGAPISDADQPGLESSGGEGEIEAIRLATSGEGVRAGRAGDALKRAWGWIKGRPAPAPGDLPQSPVAAGPTPVGRPAEEEDTGYYEDYDEPDLDEILVAPSPMPGPEVAPLFQELLANPIVVDLVESFNQAIQELAASDPDVQLLTTRPPFMQLGELMRQKPERFTTTYINQKLADHRLTTEQLANLVEAFATQSGRGLQYFSQLQRQWEQIYREDVELAKKLGGNQGFSLRAVFRRGDKPAGETGPRADQLFEKTAAVVPPATIARMALKDLEAGVLGHGWWARSGDLVRKMYLNQLKILFNNIFTTTLRIPVGLADGLSYWALGAMQPGRYGKGFSLGERMQAARDARKASLKGVANVLSAMKPTQLAQLIRNPGSLPYNQAITALEQVFPDIHQKLHQPASQIQQQGVTSPILKLIEAQLNTLEKQVITNRQNAKLVSTPHEATALIREANRIDKKRRELQERYDVVNSHNNFNNTLAGKTLENVDWAYGLLLKPQTWQEYFFRRPYFIGALHNELAIRGFDLTAIMASGEIERIPQEAVDAALDAALEFTYAYGPRQESKGLENAVYHALRLMNHPAAGPIGPLIGVPFARALYNGLLFAHDYMGVGALHAAPKALFDFARDPKGDNRRVSPRDLQILGRTSAGMVMFGAAWFLRKLIGGDEWHQLKTGMTDKKGRPVTISVRNMWPWAGYLYLADRTQRIHEGRMGDIKLSEEIPELFFGMQRTPELAGSFGALIDVFGDRTASEEEGKWLRASEAGGRLLSIPLTPFLNLRDMAATFDEEDNKRLDTRDVPGLGKFSSRLLGPSMERLPWLSNYLQPWQAPMAEGPQPLGTLPVLGQIPGIKLTPRPNFAYGEMKRLGLSPYKWLKPDRDPAINRRQFEIYSSMIESISSSLEEDQSYHAMSDKDKAWNWERLLAGTDRFRGFSDIAREEGRKANPEEAARRKAKAKIGESIGPLGQKALGLEDVFAPDKMTPVP